MRLKSRFICCLYLPKSTPNQIKLGMSSKHSKYFELYNIFLCKSIKKIVMVD